jgi:hypothetical protein
VGLGVKVFMHAHIYTINFKQINKKHMENTYLNNKSVNFVGTRFMHTDFLCVTVVILQICGVDLLLRIAHRKTLEMMRRLVLFDTSWF